jgi:hypothetical protein
LTRAISNPTVAREITEPVMISQSAVLLQHKIMFHALCESYLLCFKLQVVILAFQVFAMHPYIRYIEKPKQTYSM